MAAEIRPGTVVTGVIPNTGKRVTGFYRGPTRWGKHVVDGERWSGDPERMPKHQWLLDDIKPVEGQELEDIMVETLAKDILSGTITKDDAVKAIVKDKKISRAAAELKLDAALDTAKAAAREAAKTAKAKRPAGGSRAAAAPREKLEHVEPAKFAELRDELGLTNKECAAAQEDAGLGFTLSRVTELTHSKGASAAMFAKVEAAWRDYAAKKAGGEALA